jgi:hypothetical protein
MRSGAQRGNFIIAITDHQRLMEAQMVLRRKLATLAGTCAGAAVLAVAVPAVASAALVGTENGITLTAAANSQTQSHQFWWPGLTLTSVPPVTYSTNGFGNLATIYGQDQLICKNVSTNTFVNLAKDYSSHGYQSVTLTWQPSLPCPSGTSPVADAQTAYAEITVKLPGSEVNYIDTGNIEFDNLAEAFAQ